MRKPAPFRREIADDIPVSAQNVLVGAEPLQPHRAARVNFARGNADLRAKAVAIAVGEARRAVLIHPGGIHQRKELTGRRLVAGNDAVRVMRTMLIDERQSPLRWNPPCERPSSAPRYSRPPVALVPRLAGDARGVERGRARLSARRVTPASVSARAITGRASASCPL